MIKFVRKSLSILGAGFILFFYSERLFWTVWRKEDSPGDHIITWLAYSVAGYAFLSAVYYFQARSTASIFLCGALYGWLVEGVLTTTLYGTEPSAPFPLSLACTSLCWHAFISGFVGWHLMRRAIAEGNARRVVYLSIGIGAFWGIWATFLWHETPPVITPVTNFFLNSFLLCCVLAFSYVVCDYFEADQFKPGWFGLSIMGIILSLFFFGQAVRLLGPRPLIILPLLLLLLWYFLNQHRKTRLKAAPVIGQVTPSNSYTSRSILAACLLMMIIPNVSTAVYSMGRALGLDRFSISTFILWYSLTPIGIGMIGWSGYRILLERNDLK